MRDIKREDHLEFSDGDTNFIAISQCPMTDDEAILNEKVLSFGDVICCRNSDKDYTCPDFYGYLFAGGKTTIQCASMSEAGEGYGSPRPVAVKFKDKTKNTKDSNV